MPTAAFTPPPAECYLVDELMTLREFQAPIRFHGCFADTMPLLLRAAGSMRGRRSVVVADMTFDYWQADDARVEITKERVSLGGEAPHATPCH